MGSEKDQRNAKTSKDLEQENQLPVAAKVHTVAGSVHSTADLHTVLEDEQIVEEGDELVRKQDLHLWLADLKNDLDFDTDEEAEGARKLIEQAGLKLGVHGQQLLQEELGEGDDE